jgi:predicted nucleotidyltransferase
MFLHSVEVSHGLIPPKIGEKKLILPKYGIDINQILLGIPGDFWYNLFSNNTMNTLQEQFKELIDRIVDAVQPLSIILFGSAARMEMGADSDVDILVVMPEGTHRRQTAQFLHTQFFGIPYAVDVIVATPDDLLKYGNENGLIYKSIMDEGKKLYGIGLELA